MTCVVKRFRGMGFSFGYLPSGHTVFFLLICLYFKTISIFCLDNEVIFIKRYKIQVAFNVLKRYCRRNLPQHTRNVTIVGINKSTSVSTKLSLLDNRVYLSIRQTLCIMKMAVLRLISICSFVSLTYKGICHMWKLQWWIWLEGILSNEIYLHVQPLAFWLSVFYNFVSVTGVEIDFVKCFSSDRNLSPALIGIVLEEEQRK